MLSDVHFEQDSWSLLWLLLQAARKETTILCFSAIITGAFQGGSLEQLQITTCMLLYKPHLTLALIKYCVLQELVQHCLLLCRWLTIFDLLDEKVVPMGSLGTSDIVTSIHIPAIKPTHFFWSFKVSHAPACCRLCSIAGNSSVDRLHRCKDAQPAAQRCRAQVHCKPLLCLAPHDMVRP
jgi:hypothetical protein